MERIPNSDIVLTAVGIVFVVLITMAMVMLLLRDLTNYFLAWLYKEDTWYELLAPYLPAEVERLRRIARNNRSGLLSVGLKLHCRGKSTQISNIFEIDKEKGFKLRRANMCIVLSPFGSAEAAIIFLELLESISGISIFNNPEVQIQVCTPGR